MASTGPKILPSTKKKGIGGNPLFFIDDLPIENDALFHCHPLPYLFTS
jgi:hypothetical protein